MSPSPHPHSRTRAALRTHVRDQSGLTLIEVIATALMVAIIALAVATALIAATNGAGDERFRSEADVLAAQDQARLRGLSDVQLSALRVTPQTRTEMLASINFTITSGASFRSATGNTGCTTSAASFYETTSTVSWTEHGHPVSIEEDSQLSRPVTGDLLVQVSDQSGAAIPATTVTATGSASHTAATDSSGCASFTGLAAGSYTVAASKPGYVDIDGSTSASQAVSLPSTGANITVELGQASGPITARLTGSGGGEADSISWETPGMSEPGATTAGAAVSSSFATASDATLYPGTYDVWAGRCAAQEPPSGSVKSVTVPAGEATGVSLTEPALVLNDVTWASSGGGSSSPVAVVPKDVVFTFSDGGCTDSWAATMASGATTSSANFLANPGQPYAPDDTLSVCAAVRESGKYYQATVTLPAGNANFSAATTVPAIGITSNSVTGQCQVQP